MLLDEDYWSAPRIIRMNMKSTLTVTMKYSLQENRLKETDKQWVIWLCTSKLDLGLEQSLQIISDLNAYTSIEAGT
jgi:hypothetical protein